MGAGTAVTADASSSKVAMICMVGKWMTGLRHQRASDGAQGMTEVTRAYI